MTSDRRAVVADAILAAAMIAVPLVSSSAFVDQYTTVKWYTLHVIAAAWLCAEVWASGSAGWPSFVRRHGIAVLALAVLAAWSALRAGPAPAVAPLVDRAACAILVLCAAWAFGRGARSLRAMVAGLALSATVTIALGLAQATGRPLPPMLTAAEGPAALFGNVNMAAQFVGLALVLLLSTAGGGRWSAGWNAFRIVLAASGALDLYLLASRSVLLALAAAAIALSWRGRRRAAVLALAVAVAAVLVWHPWPRRDPMLAAHKASSVELRLALWADTITMIVDRPLGVGASNFEHAFLPYQARGHLEPQEALVFRNPHDEYLRILAEDGVLFAALAAALGALLAARWRTAARPSPDLRTVVVGWGAFLAVEAAFQFPLALAFGALAASITTGAALAEYPHPPPSPRTPWMAGGTVASLLLLAATARIAWSEALYVRGPEDLASLRRACALDARNLPACVTAAWLEVREGDATGAIARLDAVLRGAPHYPPALKLRGEIGVMQGDAMGACRALGEYDALYRGRSSVHQAAADACAR